MELMKLSKKELMVECDKLGITKCKSKSKDELIKLISSKNYNPTMILNLLKRKMQFMCLKYLLLCLRNNFGIKKNNFIQI
jgi:hypothetical protein